MSNDYKMEQNIPLKVVLHQIINRSDYTIQLWSTVEQLYPDSFGFKL